VLGFTRGRGACVVNFTDQPRQVPPSWRLGRRVVTTEEADDDAVLPPNSTSWFALVDLTPPPGRAD
jgi:hypothetical protein